MRPVICPASQVINRNSAVHRIAHTPPCAASQPPLAALPPLIVEAAGASGRQGRVAAFGCLQAALKRANGGAADKRARAQPLAARRVMRPGGSRAFARSPHFRTRYKADMRGLYRTRLQPQSALRPSVACCAPLWLERAAAAATTAARAMAVCLPVQRRGNKRRAARVSMKAWRCAPSRTGARCSQAASRYGAFSRLPGPGLVAARRARHVVPRRRATAARQPCRKTRSRCWSVDAAADAGCGKARWRRARVSAAATRRRRRRRAARGLRSMTR